MKSLGRMNEFIVMYMFILYVLGQCEYLFMLIYIWMHRHHMLFTVYLLEGISFDF